MKQPTVVWLVEKALRETDDLLTVDEILRLVHPGERSTVKARVAVLSALTHLYHHRVVEQVWTGQKSGRHPKMAYFALPADDDTRTTRIVLREEEVNHRRPCTRRRKKPPAV
jgi:hypothetical protein